MAAYEQSRTRAGITMEGAFEQPTPMGSFVVGYVEAERDAAATMAALASSDLAVDRDFAAAVKEVHGFDMSQPPGPPPETVAEWVDPDVVGRRRGLGACAPLLPAAPTPSAPSSARRSSGAGRSSSPPAGRSA
jgi:hypothetical protein